MLRTTVNPLDHVLEQLEAIQRIEQIDGVSTSRGDTLDRIEKALMAGGIEFIGGSTEAPGVRC